MSKIISNLGAAAGEWNSNLIWLAVNVGYITAELPHLEREGDTTDDIVEWLHAFPYLQETAARYELEAFTAARAADSGECDIEAVRAPLLKLRGVMSKWLRKLYDIAERHTQANAKMSGVLMSVCGVEIFKAHEAFGEVLDSFLVILPYMQQDEEDSEAIVH